MASLILTPASFSSVWAIIDLEPEPEPVVVVVLPTWIASDVIVDVEVVEVLVRDSSREVVVVAVVALPEAGGGWSAERVMERCWLNILDSPTLSA